MTAATVSDIRVEIPGRPVPKARARRGRGGHWYTPERTREYEEKVAAYALKARTELARAYPHVPWPLGSRTRYRLDVEVHLAGRRRLDLDNILKAIADGANGVLWADDSQIIKKTIGRVDVESSAEGVVMMVTVKAQL